MSKEAVDDFFIQWSKPGYLSNSIGNINDESYDAIRDNFSKSNIVDALMLSGSNIYEMGFTTFVAGYLLANHVQRYGLNKIIDR